MSKLLIKSLKYAFLALLAILAVLLLLILFLLSLSREVEYKCVHNGKYSNSKRIGLWEMQCDYRLDNGNDGRESRKGHYNIEGFQDGIWIIQTPYVSAIYFYENGVVRKSIESNTYKLTTTLYDEFGKLLSESKGTKQECDMLSKHFNNDYYRNEICEKDEY